MLRTGYLLLRCDIDTGEEPQPLSGLPDPWANEGGGSREQVLTLEVKVREAIHSPAGKRNQNFPQRVGHRGKGTLFTKSSRQEQMTYSQSHTHSSGGWGEEKQNKRPDGQLDFILNMMDETERGGELEDADREGI